MSKPLVTKKKAKQDSAIIIMVYEGTLVRPNSYV